MVSGTGLTDKDKFYIFLLVLHVTVSTGLNWWSIYFPTPIWGLLSTVIVALIAAVYAIVEVLRAKDGDGRKYKEAYNIGYGEGLVEGFLMDRQMAQTQLPSTSGSQPLHDDADDQDGEPEDDDMDKDDVVEMETETERS